MFKYIWTPAGNCYPEQKERRKCLAESKRLWFYSFLLPTELEGSDRLTCSFHFQGANLQFKTRYHYITNITEAHTRTRKSILHVQRPLAGGAKGLWSPLQQTQLCDQSDSIMQINSSIFYSPFRSHHSALSWSLVSNQITGIMPCLWKSQRMGEEVLKDLLNHISYSPISTLGTKHKFGIIITSAQVPNTQQRRQKGHSIHAVCSNIKFKCESTQQIGPLIDDHDILLGRVEILKLLPSKRDSLLLEKRRATRGQH